MVAINERAASLLREIKARQSPGQVLRLVGQSGGEDFQLLSDVPGDDDQVVEKDGMALLHIANELAVRLESSLINLKDTPQGPRLFVLTPMEYPLANLSRDIVISA